MIYDEETKEFIDEDGCRVGMISRLGHFDTDKSIITADELHFIANTLDRLNGVDWTTAKPTEEGHYLHELLGMVHLCQIHRDEDGLFVFVNDDDQRLPLELVPGKWGRKIEFPEVGK